MYFYLDVSILTVYISIYVLCTGICFLLFTHVDVCPPYIPTARSLTSFTCFSNPSPTCPRWEQVEVDPGSQLPPARTLHTALAISQDEADVAG